MQSNEEQRGSERRRHRRHAIRAVGTINHGRMLIPCILMNLSRSGAQIRLLDNEHALPREVVMLDVRGIGLLSVNVVWQKGAFAGLKFAAEIALDPPAQAAAA
jgi:hypothetical protein